MNTDLHAKLHSALRTLAESFAATTRYFEQTHTLLRDALACCQAASLNPAPANAGRGVTPLVVDEATLTVTFRGRSCFLGNTLPFHLMARLARGPNQYFTHDQLLADVWDGVRSSDAIRSVVKTLRQKLRGGGLGDLAAAIDGSAAGRYALKL